VKLDFTWRLHQKEKGPALQTKPDPSALNVMVVNTY